MPPPSSRRGPGSGRACASVRFAWSASQVALADEVELESHVVVAGRTTIGAKTRIFPFASIGHQPQDLKYKGEPSTLEVGSECIIREGVTLNPGTEGGGMQTVIGDRCAFLANSHVGHDCRVGSNVIFSNNVMLAGHCTVGDFAILGGGAAVIQFARVGAHAFLGGMSGLENDLIPYGMALGNRAHLSGLNIIGLQRRGFSREDIHSLRRAYRRCLPTKARCWSVSMTWRRSSRAIRSSRRSSPSSAPAASARCACPTPRRDPVRRRLAARRSAGCVKRSADPTLAPISTCVGSSLRATQPARVRHPSARP